VDELFDSLSSAMKKAAIEVCGTRKVGGSKKGTCWWDEQTKILSQQKKDLYLQSISENIGDQDRFRIIEIMRAKNKELRKMVRKKKGKVNENLGKKMNESCQQNKMLFWSEAKRARGDSFEVKVAIKDDDGNILMNEKEAINRWSGYYEELLDIRNDRDPEISLRGTNDFEREAYTGNEDILLGEIENAIKMLKNGKSAGVDDICSEMLKEGGEAVKMEMWKLCQCAWRSGYVPKVWTQSIIKPIYKGKGMKMECKNYRGISLSSIAGKVFARILVDRVRRLTNKKLSVEQSGFREGMGCIDQIFSVRQVVEKYLEKGKKVYSAFIDLEKAYDKVSRKGLWKVLEIYGVQGRLLQAVQSFYQDSKACVRVGEVNGEWFEVKNGLRQGCVMSPWLFNIYMDGVVREVKDIVGNVGIKLMNEEIDCHLTQLLYADDTALLSETETGLRLLVEKFAQVCQKRLLKINEDKSKLMIFEYGETSECDIRVNGRFIEVVDKFCYLGCMLSKDGTGSEEIDSRVMKGRSVSGAIKKLVKEKHLSIQCARALHEGVLLPTLLYGNETLSMYERDASRLQAVEMSLLRSAIGVTRRDRIRNENIREVCGVTVSLRQRARMGRLRWFGHMKRMNETRWPKRIYESIKEGVRRIGRPRKRWKECIEYDLRGINVDVDNIENLVANRVIWRNIVKG
jgi:hypothetical protein